MFLENLEPSRSDYTATGPCRRSLSGRFIFLSQTPSLRFAAEACIDVLRAANRLIGADVYTWSVAETEAVPDCGPDQTLVLVGGMDEPWRPDSAQLPELLFHSRRVSWGQSASQCTLISGQVSARRRAALNCMTGQYAITRQ